VPFLDRVILQEMAPRQVRYLSRLDYNKANGIAREALQQMEKEFLPGPPITLHLANPELLAGVWSMVRESMVVGLEGRTLREVIAGTVSRLNTCPYCFDMHAAMLYSFASSPAAASLEKGGEFDDPALQAVAGWAAATLTPGADILKRPPFSAEQAPRMIGTAVCFHYLNRMVNVFLPTSPLPVRGSIMSRVAGKILQPRLANRNAEPGKFLDEMEDRPPLPPEFAWAKPNPHVAGAFRRFVSAAVSAGEESLDSEVRNRVEARIEAWGGEAPGLGGEWIRDSISGLGEDQRASGRLALLTALGSWQIDDAVIADFRSRQPHDRDLINVTSWASYTAARRIASWL
jgi:AhpD family alkylhydroperoxidase